MSTKSKWWDIEGNMWRDIGNGLLTCVDIARKEFRIRHVSALNYEVGVDFGYARHDSTGLSNILDIVTADKEFWLLVEGALKHQIIKETRGTTKL